MPFSKETFGHRLKVARVDKKMNQDELAKRSGVARDSIARYELGETSPGLDNAYKLAETLDVSLNHLCDFPA